MTRNVVRSILTRGVSDLSRQLTKAVLDRLAAGAGKQRGGRRASRTAENGGAGQTSAGR